MVLGRFKSMFGSKEQAAEDPAQKERARKLREETRAQLRAEAQAAEDARRSADPSAWTQDRVAAVERVWGPGFLTPGSADQIPTLLKPFGLTPSMSVLDLGAGLGGPARHMAHKYGTYVTGLEKDPYLIKLANERAVKANLEKKAQLHQFNPDAIDINKRYDALFSKETFFKIQDKDQLFEQLKKCMKPRGQVLFTDYVLAHSAASGKVIDHWRATEFERPWPLTVNQTIERLRTIGFDIRISEDITDRHSEMINDAWDRVGGMIPELKMNKGLARAMLNEGEVWLSRMAAMETGDLRVYRFFSLAPGETAD